MRSIRHTLLSFRVLGVISVALVALVAAWALRVSREEHGQAFFVSNAKGADSGPQSVQPAESGEMAKPPRYERVRIATKEDLDKLYPLIRSYVLDPSLAETVRDVYIDTYGWKSPCYFRQHLDIEEKVNEVDVEVHDAIQKALHSHVGSLGLDSDMQAEMLEALDNERRLVTRAWTLPADKRDKVREKFGHAVTALLLSFCTNVENVSLGRLFRDDILHNYLRMANYGLLPQPVLQKLKSARVLGWELDERNYSQVEIFQCIQYFHRLPNMNTITMDGVEDYQMNFHYYVSRTGSLRKLELTHSTTESDVISKLIRIPRVLEELKVSFGGLWTGDGGHPAIEFGGISSALLEHTDTLRRVDMDFEITSRMFPPHGYDAEDDPFTGSEDGDSDDEWLSEEERREYEAREKADYGLQYIQMDEETAEQSTVSDAVRSKVKQSHFSIFDEMKVLTHLSISVTTIVSPDESRRLVDSLPTSLQYLCFYGYKRGKHPIIDSNIDELRAMKAEKLPNLKEIRGVDEMVKGLRQIHGYHPDEKDLYEKPDGNFRVRNDGPGWTEASS